jgi:hypothetical protein
LSWTTRRRKVYSADGQTLEAVVRPPVSEMALGVAQGLLGVQFRDSTSKYRVDCRVADDALKTAIAGHVPGVAFEYHEDLAWTWRDNGTYHEVA